MLLITILGNDVNCDSHGIQTLFFDDICPSAALATRANWDRSQFIFHTHHYVQQIMSAGESAF
jgi:hypothetical protein